MAAPLRFTAPIRKAGLNPYVTVPAAVSRALAGRGFVPVRVAVGRGHVTTTLVPRGRGRHRLFVNQAMLALAGARVGYPLALALVRIPRPRPPPLPPALAAGLAADPRRRAAWDALRPSRRREVLRYLHHTRRADTLARHVARILAGLTPPPGRPAAGRAPR